MSEENQQPIRGRGASDNPANRFEGEYLDYDLNEQTGEKPKQETKLIPDHNEGIITQNNSPDIPFEYSLNPYRGCDNGCIYFYARHTHELLAFSACLNFESRIKVCYNAAQNLRMKLASPNWRLVPVTMSGVMDPYQPSERKLKCTRFCLVVFADTHYPVIIIIKYHLVMRDIDYLSELAK